MPSQGIERDLREAVWPRPRSETSEMQRNIVARICGFAVTSEMRTGYPEGDQIDER